MTRLSSAGSNSHTVAVLAAAPSFRLRCGKGSGGRDHSKARHLKPDFEPVRPPGSARIDQSWKITRLCLRESLGRLQHCAVDDNAEGDIFPESDQQLSGQRNDRAFLVPPAIRLDAINKPSAQGR